MAKSTRLEKSSIADGDRLQRNVLAVIGVHGRAMRQAVNTHG
jgi:hypothetical protein